MLFKQVNANDYKVNKLPVHSMPLVGSRIAARLHKTCTKQRIHTRETRSDGLKNNRVLKKRSVKIIILLGR